MPQRIQMSRQRPWRTEYPDAIIVARPTRWGNPYTIEMMQERVDKIVSELGNDGSFTADSARTLAVEAFEADLRYGPDSAWWWLGPHMAIIRICGDIDDLTGHDLACWCPVDQPCHADVLLELANGPTS